MKVLKLNTSHKSQPLVELQQLPNSIDHWIPELNKALNRDFFW